MIISRYSPRRNAALLDLARLALGETPERPKSEQLWAWKHAANPFGRSFGFCAWESDRPLGLRLFMRWTFTDASGKKVRALRAVDTATHPEYRRRGIFSELTRRALRETTAELVFNTPNAISFAGYRKLGWRRVTRWPLERRELEPGRPRAGASAWDACFSPEIVPFAEFARRNRRTMGSLVEAWEGHRVRGALRTPRTPEYLSWRYGEHPHIRYGVKAIFSGRALTGFVVLRPRIESATRKVMITEMFLRDRDPGLGRELIAATIDDVRADHLLAHFAGRSSERRILRAARFRRVPGRGVLFAARPLRSIGVDPFSIGAWDLSLGDLEVF